METFVIIKPNFPSSLSTILKTLHGFFNEGLDERGLLRGHGERDEREEAGGHRSLRSIRDRYLKESPTTTSAPNSTLY